jgi:hypothetical protein
VEEVLRLQAEASVQEALACNMLTLSSKGSICE